MNTATAIRPIEHPARIGEQNRHMLDSLASAYRAAQALVDDGYTVLDVTVGKRNPLVIIQNCGRCHKLRGVSATRRVGPLGREQVMVAMVHGAQVEWVVRGN